MCSRNRPHKTGANLYQSLYQNLLFIKHRICYEDWKEALLFPFTPLYLLIKISMTGCAAVSTWGILYTHGTWQVWLIWFSVYLPVNHLFSYYKVAQLCSISHWKLDWQVMIVRHSPGRVCAGWQKMPAAQTGCLVCGSLFC